MKSTSVNKRQEKQPKKQNSEKKTETEWKMWLNHNLVKMWEGTPF